MLGRNNILIHSQSIEFHLKHLRKVLNIFQVNKAEINFKKFIFCNEQINYLGQIISKEGIRADTGRVENFQVPNIKSKKDLRNS